MGISNIKNPGNSISPQGIPKPQKNIKRVADIILNQDHPSYRNTDSIGTIFFEDEKTGETSPNPSNLPTAKPLNLNNYTLPLIGELVQIIQATSGDYYPELGGKSNYTSNYYTSTINVHNNAGSNALPLNKNKRKKSKTSQSQPTFTFKKEFRSSSREAADRQLENYLRDLGYAFARSDPRAPVYKLYQASNGDYIFRLDDSKENRVKLGEYYQQNPTQKNLSPTEGSTIFQGKNGQRINFTTTGPTGTNPVSNNVTDDPNDGNPTIGNKAMVLSLGNNSQENITDDAASIYMVEDNNVNIDVSSPNIESLKSEYTEYKEPLEMIETIPASIIPNTEPSPTLEVDHFNFADTTTPEVTETSTSPVGIDTEADDFEEFDDPVFGALDEAVSENILTLEEINNDISEGEFIVDDMDFLTDGIYIAFDDPSSVIGDTFDDADWNNIPSHETVYTNYDASFGAGNFLLRDFVRSDTAKANNVVNMPGVDFKDGGDYTAKSIMNAINQLTINCLDPIKAQFPSLKISSGLRTGALNAFIKGASSTSEHRLGRAADIQAPGFKTFEIFNWIINNNIPYNQIVWEYPEKGKRSWIHISYKRGDLKSNRTICTGNDKLKPALEEKYPGDVKFARRSNGQYKLGPRNETYARYIKILNVPDHKTLI